MHRLMRRLTICCLFLLLACLPVSGPRAQSAGERKVVFLTLETFFQGRPSPNDRVRLTFRDTKAGILYSRAFHDRFLSMGLRQGEYELLRLYVWHATGPWGSGWEKTYIPTRAARPRHRTLHFRIQPYQTVVYLGRLRLNLFRPKDLKRPVSPGVRNLPTTFRLQVVDRFAEDRARFRDRLPLLRKRYPILRLPFTEEDRTLPDIRFTFFW